jgi:hypothetical protein
MGKQDSNGLTNSSMNSTPQAKRFRSDMASIRAKQTTPMTNSMNNKRNSLPYRPTNTNQSYQRANLASTNHQIYNNNDQQQQQQQVQILSPSPQHESFDENFKLINSDVKQTNEIELNMNCLEEQLSEAQLNHRPVKASRSKRKSQWKRHDKASKSRWSTSFTSSISTDNKQFDTEFNE